MRAPINRTGLRARRNFRSRGKAPASREEPANSDLALDYVNRKRRYVLAFFRSYHHVWSASKLAPPSSHCWSRELQALGHTVRLMPPAYVKPYVKRQKNDMADAEAMRIRSEAAERMLDTVSEAIEGRA